MIGNATTEARAREAFRTAWHDVVSHMKAAPQGVDEECLLASMSRELVELAGNQLSRPVRDLAPTIRRMLTDVQFIDENGDSVIDAENHLSALERQVEVAVRVLEDLRREDNAQDDASRCPSTAIYFG